MVAFKNSVNWQLLINQDKSLKQQTRIEGK